MLTGVYILGGDKDASFPSVCSLWELVFTGRLPLNLEAQFSDPPSRIRQNALMNAEARMV